MNEMEQRARMRNLDDLAKEMDRYEADRYRNRGKAVPQVNVAVKEVEAAPEPPQDQVHERIREDANPASEPSSPSREKPFYMDPNKESILQGAEANAKDQDDFRKMIMSRGQFGKSRKA